MKKLIPALCMLLIAACMLGTSTYAWFSMNRTVTATGMQVRATTADSLVIGTATAVGTDITVTNGTTANVLTPATHIASDETYTAYPNGLKWVTNMEDIDASTGYVHSAGTDYVYSSATNTSTTKYFVDQVVYIAASGQAMTGKTLNISFDENTASYVAGLATASAGTKDTEQAISADIYIQAVNSSSDTLTYDATTFVDTLDLAHAATDVVTKTNVNIPLNTSGNAIRITFRIYLDGALQKESGQAYVYNDMIDVTDVNIGFAITVNDAA